MTAAPNGDTSGEAQTGNPPTARALYEVEWDGKDDYLPDSALDRIKEVVLDRLPVAGFDMPSCNATQRTVTATLAFDLIRDPESQIKALEAVLQASTVVRTLHANLVAARAALAEPVCADCGGERFIIVEDHGCSGEPPTVHPDDEPF